MGEVQGPRDPCRGDGHEEHPRGEMRPGEAGAHLTEYRPGDKDEADQPNWDRQLVPARYSIAASAHRQPS